MNIDLKNKRAIVCGSTEGIGRAIALGLAELGASVTLIARNEEKLKNVKQALSIGSKQNHHYLVADFDKPEELEKVIAAYVLDNKEIAILINNSGGPAGGKAIDAGLEEFQTAFNRHLMCNQILVKAVAPSMKAGGYGRIVNIISTSVKAPLPGLGVSNTIRGAVANWAKTLSVELAPFGITVNNVLPGATLTGRLGAIIKNKASKAGVTEQEAKDGMLKEIPAGRFASADEIANAACFLASPAAGYINGINLPVDGGRLSCL
ncbi:MAG TPA: SDR family oxidoreductase [Fulvivirga sp.]|nr:SDR family oxidoreductase [Fulvivirga sp.]